MKFIKYILTLTALNFYIINLSKCIYAFVPQSRAEHNAILIDDKVYFLVRWFYDGSDGSHTNSHYVSDALFYLNVSIPFTLNISSMPWTDLSSLPGLINQTGASVCIDAHLN
ncbi:12681_t:CDS:1, partial [Dentiscutata heterogama]